MTSPVRRFTAIIIFIIFAVIVIAILSRRLIVKSLPDYEATIEIAILESEASVYWDEFKVPHIYAQNEQDLFRVAGYVAAQERLWQMDLCRRIAAGRLSEIFGERTLENDVFARTWGFERAAQNIEASLSTESRTVLDAYAEGVNFFIEKNRDALPVEFALLGYEPEPWKISDSIAYARFMAFQLSFTWHLEPILHLIAQKTSTAQALELFPEFPQDAPSIVSATEDVPMQALAGLIRQTRQARSFLGGSGTIAGSNSWVVGPQKSTSGKPILANDPHLSLLFPSVWFEMHLVGGDYDVMGVTFPGVPGVVIGHNRAIAWGLTNGMVDDADFYIEKRNAANAEQYWDGANWRPFEVISETIHIKDSDEPHYFDVRLTQNGPIVSPPIDVLENDSLLLSVRWTGHMPSDEVGAMLSVNRAKNWPEFLEAAERYKVPTQNFIFADTSGTIGYTLAGALPIRQDGKGYFLYKGWEKAGNWSGMVPFSALPKKRNPTSGFIATANNKITGQNSNIYFGNAWEPDSRIQRITSLLSAKTRLNVDDFKNMQGDVYSHHAEKMLAVLMPVLKNADLTDNERDLQKLLEEWDFQESWESVPATVYHVFFVHLLRNALKDELGEEVLNAFLHWSNFPIRAMENLVSLPGSKWWDDVTTLEQERMAEIATQSFRDAIQQLYDEVGNGPGFWEWGLLHKVRFVHPMGQHELLGRLFNTAAFAVGGSPNSIAKAEYKLAEPFSVKAGASMRQIVDFAHIDSVLSVIAGGQSGQPFSEHYADQVDLWRAGHYKVARMERRDIEKYATDRQAFRPQN